MIGPLSKRAKYLEGKELVNVALESVSGYGTTNNGLPDLAGFQSTVRTTTDPWGGTLSYFRDANLETGFCGRKSTSITVRECTNADCSAFNAVNNVAFVVASRGGNYTMQTALNGGIVRVYPTDMPIAPGPRPYDDIVKWVTLPELRMQGGCVGPQLKIANTILPFGNHSTSYNTEVFAEGGVPFTGGGGDYRWCVETASGSLPAWTVLNPAATPVSADCQGAGEASWRRRDSLGITGTSLAGTTSLTVYARDNNDTASTNDNIAEKLFVITINP